MRGKVAYYLTAVDRIYGGVPRSMEEFIKFKYKEVETKSGVYYKAVAIKLLKDGIEILKSDKSINNFIFIINKRYVNIENLTPLLVIGDYEFYLFMIKRKIKVTMKEKGTDICITEVIYFKKQETNWKYTKTITTIRN